MINEFLDNVQARISAFFTDWFGSWFAWMHDPLTFWILCFVALFAACFVVGWFLPFKWIRAGLGGILVIAGAFLAGGIEMRKEMNERLAKEREKQRKLSAARKAQPPQKSPGSWW